MQVFNSITALLILTVLLPSVCKAQSFSDYKPATANYTEITAEYEGMSIIAWTGFENEKHSKSELLKLATKRADLLCKNFGFKSGTFAENYPRKGGAGWNKELAVIPTAAGLRTVKKCEIIQGQMSPCSPETDIVQSLTLFGPLAIDLPRFFTKVYCLK